jgi:hypothetical protein
MAATRLRLAVEEHGAGTQLVRLRSWPRYSGVGMMLTALLAMLAAAALLDGATIAGAILGAFAFLLAASAVRDCAAATGLLLHAVAEPRPDEESAEESRVEEPAAASAEWEMEPARSDNGHEGVPASTTVGELPSRARVARLSEPE